MRYRLTVSKKLRRQWNHFEKQWNVCKKCDLNKTRQRVVHGRGRFPCSVLFIGEAPGKTEDSLGLAFVGSSGKLLDEHIIPDAFHKLERVATYALVNTLGCIPLSATDKDSIRVPEQTELNVCYDHMNELIMMASPKACVTLGKTAANWVGTHVTSPPHGTFPTLNLYHPAYLLRTGGTKSIHYQDTVKRLAHYLHTRL